MMNNTYAGMSVALGKVLSFEMTMAEWIGTAVMLAIPYLVTGVLWPAFHTHQLADTVSGHRTVLALATIASWPTLLVAMCA